MIVVTGGAGFIGSNLLAGLEQAGYGDLIVCDAFGDDDKWRNVAKRAIADVVHPDALERFLYANAASVDLVFHLGAISATTETDVDRLVERNIAPTMGLWRWASENGKRLIYASSAATYGDGEAGFDDDPSAEALARLKPLNAYGWSKHVCDRRFTELARRGEPTPTQWAGLKFFNVYGPNEYHKGGMRSVAVQLFEQFGRDGAARLFRSHRPDYADGGQLRDFVWVGDCVDVMLWLAETPDVSGLFNLGTGQARSFADLANAAAAAMNISPRIDFIDTPEAIRDRYQYFTEARMQRLRDAGYAKPFTSLEEGVATYIQDFLATDDPYR